MGSKVHFEVESDVAKVIQDYLKVAEGQDRVVRGFKKVAEHGKGAHDVMHSVGHVAREMLSGFASFEAVKDGVAGTIEMLKEYAQRHHEFEKDITGLLAEGDNIEHIEKVKEKVLSLAAAYGVTRAQAAEALSATSRGLENAGGGAAEKALRMALDLSKSLGMELPQAVAFTVKAMQGYSDELGDVAKAEDKLFQFARGLSGVEDPAEFLARVSVFAQHAKVSLDEMSGTLQTLTLFGGKNRQTAGAANSIYQGMAEMVKDGLIKPMESYEEKIKTIGKLDPDTLKKYFSDAVPYVELLTKHVDVLLKKIIESRDAPGGEVQKRLSKRAADFGYTFGETQEAIKSGTEGDVLKDIGWLKDFGPGMQSSDLLARGYKLSTPAWAHGFVGGNDANLTQHIFRWLIRNSHIAGGKQIEELGLDKTLEDLEKQGRFDEAEALRISQGVKVRDPLQGLRATGAVTGSQDLQRFFQLRQKYGQRFTSTSYSRVRALETEIDNNPPVSGSAWDDKLHNEANRRAREEYQTELDRYFKTFGEAADKMNAAAELHKEAADVFYEGAETAHEAAERQSRKLDGPNPAQKE